MNTNPGTDIGSLQVRATALALRRGVFPVYGARKANETQAQRIQRQWGDLRHTVAILEGLPTTRGTTTRSGTRSSILAAACHEAGHALVCHLRGGRISRLTASTRGSGTVWHSSDPLHAVVISLAGPAAELLAGGASQRSLRWKQIEARSAWRGDLKKARAAYDRWARAVYLPQPRFEVFAEREVSKLYHELKGHTPALAALAKALSERGNLDGAEAHRIIRDNTTTRK